MKYVSSINKIHIIALFFHPNFKSLSLLHSEPLVGIFGDFDIIHELEEFFPEAFQPNEPVAKQVKENEIEEVEPSNTNDQDVCSDDELMDSSQRIFGA